MTLFSTVFYFISAISRIKKGELQLEVEDLLSGGTDTETV